MKKILLASLMGLASTQAAAQEEIKFAMEATYAPFEYVDENNQIQGFDVDLANALCDVIEAKCSFHNQPFDSLIPALKFRRYDAAISGIDITEQRLQVVNFSDAYYDNSAAFVSIKGKVTDQTSLKGKRVGVQNGSTHQSYLTEQMDGVAAIPYASYQDAFLDMQNGRIDAVYRRRRAEEGDKTNRPKVVSRVSGEKVHVRPWSAYANDPLRDKLIRDLVPQLRDYLKQNVPEHMVPSAFMVLDDFPLNPNGKVDRRALPAPGQSRGPVQLQPLPGPAVLSSYTRDTWPSRQPSSREPSTARHSSRKSPTRTSDVPPGPRQEMAPDGCC